MTTLYRRPPQSTSTIQRNYRHSSTQQRNTNSSLPKSTSSLHKSTSPPQYACTEKNIKPVSRSNSLAKNDYKETPGKNRRNNEVKQRPSPSKVSKILCLSRQPQRTEDEDVIRRSNRSISVSWSSTEDKVSFSDEVEEESVLSDGHYSIPQCYKPDGTGNHSAAPHFRPHSAQTLPNNLAAPHSNGTLPRRASEPDQITSTLPHLALKLTLSQQHSPDLYNLSPRSFDTSTVHTRLNLNTATFHSDSYKAAVFSPPHPVRETVRDKRNSKGTLSRDKGTMSRDKGTLSRDKGTMSRDKGTLSRDKGQKDSGKENLLRERDDESTQVKQYLAALPEDKRPVNTLGVQWRIKQLQTQLPRYDHNINYCHEMSPEEQEELFMFVESRKEKAQGQGEVKSFKKKNKKKCEKCGGLVDCAVIADKIPGRVWHPGCFNCTTCEEILVDLIYFQYDGRLYCGRHHAELLRPRCHACDELIFGQEFITADKHEYHKEHFCCWECDAGLGGAKYVSHKGQPYCQGCYEKLFCTRCVTCREPIGAGAPLFKHGTLRWHGNPQCYACSFCKTSLVNRTFMPTERYVYCSKNCYRCHESLRKTKGK